MKKTFILVLLILLTLAFVTGCSKKASNSNNVTDNGSAETGANTTQPATNTAQTNEDPLVSNISSEILTDNETLDVGDVI